jgi:hypothetical protein
MHMHQHLLHFYICLPASLHYFSLVSQTTLTAVDTDIHSTQCFELKPIVHSHMSRERSHAQLHTYTYEAPYKAYDVQDRESNIHFDSIRHFLNSFT